jgi:RimJ/RimL family protein N-acetyltransferase
MLKLEPFSSDDFSRLILWNDSKKKLTQFAGTLFTYPLTTTQLKKYSNNPKLFPKKIIALDTGEVIGHCELNFSNETPRLSRILIGDENYRGKGFGKQIVNLMIEEIKAKNKTKQLELKVYGWNNVALKLYKNCGFVVDTELSHPFQFSPTEIWKSIHMIKEI